MYLTTNDWSVILNVHYGLSRTRQSTKLMATLMTTEKSYWSVWGRWSTVQVSQPTQPSNNNSHSSVVLSIINYIQQFWLLARVYQILVIYNKTLYCCCLWRICDNFIVIVVWRTIIPIYVPCLLTIYFMNKYIKQKLMYFNYFNNYNCGVPRIIYFGDLLFLSNLIVSDANRNIKLYCVWRHH